MQIRPTSIASSAPRSPVSRIVEPVSLTAASEVAVAQDHAALEPMVIDLPNSDAVLEVRVGELPKIVEQMNHAVQIFTSSLRFEVHEDHRVLIRVVDNTTGEVVREIPPERLLDAFNRLEDLVGLLLDQKL
jgi:flagellar protein FlaG